MTLRRIVVDDDSERFRISGPSLTLGEDAPPEKGGLSAEGHPSEEQSVPRVMVVDDDPDIRRMLTLFLRLEGFEVSTAADGASALELLKNERPDVILLDLMMPVLDGYQVIEHLSSDDNQPHVPIIVITAKADDMDVWEGWCRGAASYITKPIDFDVLHQEIARVTSGRCAA